MRRDSKAMSHKHRLEYQLLKIVVEGILPCMMPVLPVCPGPAKFPSPQLSFIQDGAAPVYCENNQRIERNPGRPPEVYKVSELIRLYSIPGEYNQQVRGGAFLLSSQGDILTKLEQVFLQNKKEQGRETNFSVTSRKSYDRQDSLYI